MSSINFSNAYLNRQTNTASSPNPKLNQGVPILFKNKVQDEQESKKNWHERAIVYLDGKEHQLDEKMPNNALQDKIDLLGSHIQAKFAHLTKFNTWLDDNGEGKWYKQLATFLIKLPARAVRNIIRLLYNIIKEAIYAIVHPLKALNHLAKLLITLVHELTKPETWSKIGAGMMGASVGQALVTGNAFSVIGLGVAAALLIAGLSVGALKSAINAEEGAKLEAAKKNLLSQAKQLPEVALTGFCMGLLIGGIQRVVYKHQMKTFKVSNFEEAKQYADSFIKKYNLPQYSKVELDPSGKIIIKWQGTELRNIERAHPEFFTKAYDGPIEFPTQLKIELQPGGGQMVTNMHGYHFESYNYIDQQPLGNIGISGRVYPLPPQNVNLSQYGALGGTAASFDSIITQSNISKRNA